jgi:hypothetical protein
MDIASTVWQAKHSVPPVRRVDAVVLPERDSHGDEIGVGGYLTRMDSIICSCCSICSIIIYIRSMRLSIIWGRCIMSSPDMPLWPCLPAVQPFWLAQWSCLAASISGFAAGHGAHWRSPHGRLRE